MQKSIKLVAFISPEDATRSVSVHLFVGGFVKGRVGHTPHYLLGNAGAGNDISQVERMTQLALFLGLLTVQFLIACSINCEHNNECNQLVL